jgi:hypothetical protein
MQPGPQPRVGLWSRSAAVGDRPGRIRAPLVERAVIDAVAVDADPLERRQGDGRRNAAAIRCEQLDGWVARVDAGDASEPGNRRGRRRQARTETGQN